MGICPYGGMPDWWWFMLAAESQNRAFFHEGGGICDCDCDVGRQDSSDEAFKSLHSHSLDEVESSRGTKAKCLNWEWSVEWAEYNALLTAKGGSVLDGKRREKKVTIEQSGRLTLDVAVSLFLSMGATSREVPDCACVGCAGAG